MFDIREDDLASAAVRDLLALHLKGRHENSPPGHGAGQVKSMRTHPDHLRQGVAAALLAHRIGQAQRRGLWRLSLETGSGPAFEPALALYRKRGFVNGEAFADYARSDFNQFPHLPLTGLTVPPAGSPESARNGQRYLQDRKTDARA
jgi:putative acetyltransferase